MAFESFDARAEFDARPYVAECPSDDHTRAMFYDLIRRAYDRTGQAAPDFPQIPFAKVERRAYNAALFQACEDLSPEVPLASALFELGRGLYPHFASTMVGKAIFSVAGRDCPAMARLAPRAYAVCNGHGTLEVLHAQPGLVHVSFDDVWDPLPFTCGIWRGGLDVCGIEPAEFEIDRLSPVRYELRIGY
ncbi:MAG: DUF2378 family protein [Nannocystaceae bacterium]|nr:DUF2378 family protein [Nannocystaceae bacterium]